MEMDAFTQPRGSGQPTNAVQDILTQHNIAQRFSAFWNSRTTYKFCLSVTDHHLTIVL